MAWHRTFMAVWIIHASVLLSIIGISSAIANRKRSFQQDVYYRSNFNLESRSDNAFDENGSETLEPLTEPLTEKPNSDNIADSPRTATRDTANSALQISARFSLFDFALDLLKSAAWLVADLYVSEYQGNHTCYRNICFTPENGLGLKVGGPKNPEEENTTFLFFDNNHRTGQVVNESTWEAFFENYTGNISKPLVAIVHGLNGSRHSPWAKTLINALLDNVNCNVLQADWQERARFPNYAKAASSAPLVGILLSFMIEKIIATSNCSLQPDNVHIVGFSLGAHAAGVCGRHFYSTTGFSLGRITGLDPAGPLFLHSNVSLSSSDAQFVDVIHTNAGDFQEGMLGLNESIGHVDFYPNGGSYQPGCSVPSETTDPACSHKRAQHLFIQSVYNNCSFKSYYCRDGWSAFKSGKCLRETNDSLIGDMGYYSFNASGRGNQYLNTTGEPPYCIINTKPGI